MAGLDEFFQGISLRDKVLGASIIVVPLFTLFMLAVIFLRPTPMSPNLVLGCYVAKGAPSLDIKRESISIGENAPQEFTYTVEPAKFGYNLSVSPAISLRPDSTGGYTFMQDSLGEGYFWPLLAKSHDDPVYLTEPSYYGGRFKIIATDGTPIIYSRTSQTSACQ